MTKENKKDNLLGSLLLLSGIVVGAATAFFIQQERPAKPKQVIENAKRTIPHKGRIEGSWIDYDPIAYDLFDAAPLVYMGGLTIIEEDGAHHIQFAADYYTGEIVDYFKTH